MVNKPKLTQAASSVMRSVQTGAPPRAWAPASVSTMRPNRTGSANCAAASETLAMASIQPSFDSLPRSLSTRVYRWMKFMMLWSAQVYGHAARWPRRSIPVLNAEPEIMLSFDKRTVSRFAREQLIIPGVHCSSKPIGFSILHTEFTWGVLEFACYKWNIRWHKVYCPLKRSAAEIRMWE